MIFDNIDINKKYSYNVLLTYKNRKPIKILSSAFDRTLIPNIDTVWGFNFSIPYYIEDNITHQKVENKDYDLIQDDLMVLVKCGDDITNPDFEYIFIIKTITESSDKLIKTVECKSSETNLNKCLFTCSGIERELYNTDTQDGILNLIEQNPDVGWTIGYVSPSCLKDNVNGGEVPKLRFIDATSQPLLTFLHDTIQKAYNCLFMYDTVNKKINVYDLDDYGTHTGILLSEENYIKDLNKTTKSENICTKLVVSGKDGLAIDTVTLDGTSCVYNYDFYMQSGQMSDELVLALGQYNILLVQENTAFQDLLTQVNTLETDLVDAESILTTLLETKKTQAGIQRAYIEAGDNVNLPTATANLNATIAQITTTQGTIDSLNSQIASLRSQMATITANIQKVNARDITTGELIFNTDLLNELIEFTLTENWSSETYTAPNLLKKVAEDVLKNYSVPTIEFSMDLIDLFAIPQTQYCKSKIKMGDLVRAYSSKLKTNADFRIVGYSYNVDTNELTINFSNKDKKLNDDRTIGSAISKATTTSNLVNKKRLIWEQMENTTDAVTVYMSNALDVARQEVLANNGKNRIDITENGINITDIDDTNNQIRILSGLIAVTEDSWNSVQTAIDAQGVVAQAIFGQILCGNKLFITSADGSVTINGTGITIKSGGNTVILSSQGIVQEYNFPAKQNVDQNVPLVSYFYIDTSTISVREAKLRFVMEAFRTDSSITSSGGTPTSSSVDNHVHLMFKYGGQDTTFPIYVYDAKSNEGVPVQMQMGFSPDWGSPPDLYTYSSAGGHFHTIGNHSHPISYGITQTTVANGCTVFCDGIARTGAYGNNPNTVEVDVTSFYQTSGWHSFSITSQTLGNITATLFIKSFVTGE